MDVSRYMEASTDNGGGGTTVQVNDNQAVSELARKVGELEAGRATVEEVNSLKADLAAVVASRDQYITRAEYNDLCARLKTAEETASTTNRAPAEIKPPSAPPKTQAEIEAEAAQAGNNPKQSAPTGPARVHVGLFKGRS